MQVRNDLHSGRLPPVQPFHAMAYPFSADLALAISSKYAQYCALTASCMRPPPLAHPRVRPYVKSSSLLAAVSSVLHIKLVLLSMPNPLLCLVKQVQRE